MNKSIQFNHYFPTTILFGDNSLEKLHKLKFPGEKALLVISSESSIRGFNILSRVEEKLLIGGINYTIFNSIDSDVNDISVSQGAMMAYKNECDFIIGLGGAKAIDTAKAISVSLFKCHYKKFKLPLWTIPTTSGFGSEVSNICILWQNQLQKKLYTRNNLLYPDFSLIDPSITRNISTLTSYQHGFIILFKAIDTFLSKDYSFFCKNIASTAIKILMKYLPRIVNSGSDLIARTYISYSNIIVSSNNKCRFHLLEEVYQATDRVPGVNYGEALLNQSHNYYAEMISRGSYDKDFKEIARIMDINSSKASDFLVILHDFKESCRANVI